MTSCQICVCLTLVLCSQTFILTVEGLVSIAAFLGQGPSKRTFHWHVLLPRGVLASRHLFSGGPLTKLLKSFQKSLSLRLRLAWRKRGITEGAQVYTRIKRWRRFKYQYFSHSNLSFLTWACMDHHRVCFVWFLKHQILGYYPLALYRLRDGSIVQKSPFVFHRIIWDGVIDERIFIFGWSMPLSVGN